MTEKRPNNHLSIYRAKNPRLSDEEIIRDFDESSLCTHCDYKCFWLFVNNNPHYVCNAGGFDLNIYKVTEKI